MRHNLEKNNQSNRNPEITKYLAIITPNVQGLISPIKRHRLSDWLKNQDPKICCLQEIHLITEDTHKLKVKGWKKIYQACRNLKQAGVATNLILDKTDFMQNQSQEIKKITTY
jgi:exonuclease III